MKYDFIFNINKVLLILKKFIVVLQHLFINDNVFYHMANLRTGKHLSECKT